MPRKLLLADDSVTIQRVIELTFADEDIRVSSVGDGDAAIRLLQSDPPDIVLADIGMPERDGYEVAEFIKRDPRLAHIPVLLLTGAFEPVDDTRARAIGCEGVLVKPFEPQMVISRVRELLTGPRTKVEPAAVPAAAAAPAAAAPAEGNDALEDYFDRLDAALANLGTTSPPQAVDPMEHVLDVAETDHGGSASPGGAPAPSAGFATQAWTGAETPAGPLPPLHAAFSALLAAEQGKPVDVPLPVPEPLSEETIEDIVKRVIARMGDEKMRTLVLDTAERLVREEIERIKRQA